MIYEVKSVLGTIVPSEEHTAGVGGVTAGQWVYLDSATGTVLPCGAATGKVLGVANNTAAATETVEVTVGYPGIQFLVDMVDPSLYAVTMQRKNYTINASGQIDLSTVTNPILKLIGQRYSYTAGRYLALVECALPAAQVNIAVA